MTPRAPSPGRLLDAGTRVWVRATGRRVDLRSAAWLDGPTGAVDRIGDGWIEREVARAGGRPTNDGGTAELLPAMAVLDGPGFSAGALHPSVRDCYERTSDWRLQAWAQWSPLAWPFGWLVARVFARRLEQLALPLRPLEVAHGMTSEVRPAVAADGTPLGTVWHRRLRSTGRTVFSGWYGAVTPPEPSSSRPVPGPSGRRAPTWSCTPRAALAAGPGGSRCTSASSCTWTTRAC